MFKTNSTCLQHRRSRPPLNHRASLALILESFVSQGTLGMQSRRLAKALLMDWVRRRSFLFEPGACNTNRPSFFDDGVNDDDDDDFFDDDDDEDKCGVTLVRSAAAGFTTIIWCNVDRWNMKVF